MSYLLTSYIQQYSFIIPAMFLLKFKVHNIREETVWNNISKDESIRVEILNITLQYGRQNDVKK